VISRLRSNRLRSNILPLLMAALLLRALIPAGFMPGSGDGASFTASMCSSQGTNETIEIPGDHAKPHCDYCVAPLFGAPLALQRFHAPAETRGESKVFRSPVAVIATIQRAQSARAPPRAI
jgi:hypothetical protein